MTLTLPAFLLLVINVCLLWLLLAAPFGMKTIRVRRTFRAAPDRLWRMVHPLGAESAWSPSLLSSRPAGEGRVIQQLAHADRRGQPIMRVLDVRTEVGPDRRTVLTRVVEDSALDPAFWDNYREVRTVLPAPDGAELVVEQADRYRGLAFLVFRFFALRRELAQMDAWIHTGKPAHTLTFEHPLTQVGLAVVSTLVIWPFFGFSLWGLMLSTILTIVIALHELGHMAAYRAFGHGRVRMIFIPLLGGMAIGGRPYNTKFEVAVCALMGAGFSAFLVPVVIAIQTAAATDGPSGGQGGGALVFLLVLTAFNLLNLLPMQRFDGGQVLRQVFPTGDGRLASTFLVTCGLLWIGHRVGIPLTILMGALAVFALLSLVGGRAVKPREQLDDMSVAERLNAGFGYYAVLGIHGYGLVFACDRLFGA